MKILVFIASLFLIACSTTPQNPEKYVEWQNNSCLPTAITMRHGLRTSTKWNEVIVYEYINSKTFEMKGHAVCAYMYPIGKNQLWAYDFEGSTRIRTLLDDPIAIAQFLENQRGRSYNNVYKAEFLK